MEIDRFDSPAHVGPRVFSTSKNLLSRANVQIAARNFSWLLLDRALRVAVGLAISVAVARHLGPANFGVLSFALAMTALFSVVAGLGLDDVLLRDLAHGRPARRLLAQAIWLRGAGAAIGYGAAVAVTVFWRAGATDVWAVVAIGAASLLCSPLEILDTWFQAQSKVRPAVVARQVALWCAAAYRLVLVWTGASVRAFALAYVVEALLVGAALALVYWRERSRAGEASRQKEEEESPRRLLHEGLPLMASGALVLLTMQADRLLLARLSGDSAVGVYAAGARFSEIFQIVPVALGAAVVGRLARLQQEDELRYWQRARQVFWGAAGMGIAIALLVSMGAPLLIPRLLGPAYEGSAQVLAVHVWSLVFVFMVSLRSRLLVIAAASRWVLGISIVTAVCAVTANRLLIPKYGAMGAAWSAVMAWGVSALLAPLLFQRTRRLMGQLLPWATSARAGA